MFDRIIVGTADPALSDVFTMAADEIVAQLGPSAKVFAWSTLRQVERSLFKKKGPTDRDLVIIDAALGSDTAPTGGEAPTDLGRAFDLVARLQSSNDGSACIFFTASLNQALFREVERMPLCALLLPTKDADYCEDGVRIARRLASLRSAAMGGPGPDAHTSGDLVHRPQRAASAWLDVNIRTDQEMAYMRLTTSGAGRATGSQVDEAQLDTLTLREIARDSKLLREELSDHLRTRAAWEKFAPKWQKQYKELGTRLSNILYTPQFAYLHGSATRAAGKQAFIRINLDPLDPEVYDVCWEAMNWQQHWIAVEGTMMRRVAFRDGRSSPTLDGGDGVINLLLIISNVWPDAELDGPADELWHQYFEMKGRFEHLPGLAEEEVILKGLEAKSEALVREGKSKITIKVTTIRSEEGDGGDSFRERLRKELEDGARSNGRRFDVVHFAGHAAFEDKEGPDGRGYLILGDKAHTYTLPISTFANWLADAGVQLVFLSCCRSSAARASLQLAEHNIPLAIGFSWDLDDQGAPRFAAKFYDALLKENLRVCRAFHKTKADFYRDHGAGDPIWAAPVLIAQPEDGSRVELCLGTLEISL